MRKLRVGFVVDDGIDQINAGVQQHIITLGGWLEKNGHQVRYLAGETTKKDIANVYSLSKNLKVRFSGNKLSTPLPASKRRIKQILAKEKFDILHVQMPYSPFLAGRVINLAPKNVSIIGTFHIFPYNWLGRVGNRALGLWLHRNLKKIDQFISVSSAAQKFALGSYGIDSRIIPNLVDVQKYKANSRQKTDHQYLKLLFFGRLVPRKGCLQLLRAIAIIRTELPGYDFKLDVCGSGPMLSQLEQFVADNNLTNVVTFCGSDSFIPEEEKIAYMRAADIAIFPSYAGESFGIVLIEAMAAGAGVVIGGDNPGYRTVLGDIAGSIVEVKDPTQFASALKKIMQDKKLRQAIHENQQREVSKYDVDTVGKQIYAAYLDCINKRNVQ